MAAQSRVPAEESLAVRDALRRERGTALLRPRLIDCAPRDAERHFGRFKAWILLIQSRFQLFHKGRKLLVNVRVGPTAQNNLTRFRLRDLDLDLEDILVAVEFGEGRDGHDLRDAAEEKDGRMVQPLDVADTIRDVMQCIGDHRVQAFHGSIGLFRSHEIVQSLRGGKLFPNLARPEHAGRGLHANVLKVVSDDVRLLQEETHAVRRAQVVRDAGILEATGRKQAGEPVANKAGDIMAIEIVIGGGDDFVLEKVEHAEGHLVAYVFNDVLVAALQLLMLAGDAVKLLKELDFLGLIADTVEAPVAVLQAGVKDGEFTLLDIQRHLHVVLHGVQPS